MWRVEEVYEAGKRAIQPGWDYVVDTGFDPSKAPIQPANKKRTAGRTPGNTTAKQDDVIWKRLKELEKDNHREVHIPVSRAKNDLGRHKGKTQATRKVLAYQKTFAMWLDQEKSDAAISAQNPVQQKSKATVHPRRQSTTKKIQEEIKEEPVEDPEPVVPLRPASDGTDDAHLLQTMLPTLPSEAVMEKLCSAPPLSYGDAQAGPSTSGAPPLQFCEVCGYWGKIKCIMCGTRTCGLSCKQKHDVECQKYGGR